MKILAIETSCDETAAAVVSGRKVLSSKIHSQILLHKKWGGVVPNLAKRAHEERIDSIVDSALAGARLSPADVDAVAVTFGPGLAPALEVGIRKATKFVSRYGKPLIPVNHMEGHVYSCFVQNSMGSPKRDFTFPYLCLLVSGGHTEIVWFADHITYKVLGSTLDDAAGEALDKAAKLLGLGYPGGPVLERLARGGDIKFHVFPRPMKGKKGLDFSFSGLKTALYYYIKKMSEREKTAHLRDIAASYQEAVIDSLTAKLTAAIDQTGCSRVLVGGGVSANMYFRMRIRKCARARKGMVYFPPYTYLSGDNAAMIGVAGSYRARFGLYSKNLESLDRAPRSSLDDVSYTSSKGVSTK